MFGEVPGVSIDLKSNESRYNVRLIQVSGRKNSGRVFTSAFGFVESKSE